MYRGFQKRGSTEPPLDTSICSCFRRGGWPIFGKVFIQLFLSKLSRDSDSGGYGVTLLGTKTSSCEGLRVF